MFSLKVPIHDILKACQNIMPLIPKNDNVAPITRYMHIQTFDDNTYTITGSDVKHALLIKQEAISCETGSILVPAGTFTSLVSRLSKKKSYTTLTIKEDTTDNSVICSAGRSKTVLHAIPTTQYLQVPELTQPDKFFTLESEQIANIVQYVYHCIGDSDRPNINGVLCKYEKGELIFTASNGCKLCEVRITKNIPYTFIAFLSPKTCDILKTISSDSSIHMAIDDNKCFFHTDTHTFIANTVDAIFPQYEPMMEQKRPVHIDIQIEDILDSIHIILALTEDTFRSKWEFTKDTITLSSGRKQQGYTEEIINIEYSHQPFAIGINAKQLFETLDHIASDEVTLEFGTPFTAIKMCHTYNNMYITNIIMPMRL